MGGGGGPIIAAVVGLALVAAACGDDDDAGSATTAAAASETTARATTAAEATTGGTTGDDHRGGRSDTTEAAADDTAGGEPATLRLGYFPNVTHAPAILGVEDGHCSPTALGSNVDLELSTFNAGTDVITALFSGALDASFIGPNPAINGYAKSEGDALRIVAGTTSGGASLVVSEDINTAADLKGKTLSTPSLGNTQDVALRWWLKEQGLATDTSGGGDV